MLVILDVKFLEKKYRFGYTQFLFEMIVQMAWRHTNDSFVFLTQEHVKTNPNLPANIRFQQVKKGPLPWMGEKWWYRNSLPKMLKKLQPALFVSLDNVSLTNISLPTCIFIIQLNAMLEKIPDKKASAGKTVSGSFKQTAALIAFSKHSRQMLQKQTAMSKSKIKLLKLGLHTNIRELMWTERESIKVKYAAGCEYFVFAGEFDVQHDLIMLLKAFSQFKKWQQSNMQLVLAGNRTAWLKEFKEKLSTFKYRDDVHIIADPSGDELDTIISGAYALVYPASFDYFPENVLRAMSCGVPVVTSKIPVIEEMAGPAVLYPPSDDEQGFAKSMQDIYKDESLRASIIQQAKSRLATGNKYDMVEECRNFFEAVFTTKS